MNNILNNIEVLLAKLTEKQYKPFKDLYEKIKEEYNKKYDDIFGVGNNRIYLNDDVIKLDINKYIDTFHDSNWYQLRHAIYKISDILDNNNLFYFKDDNLDIFSNRIYSKDGREFKLTKVLQMLIDDKIKNLDESSKNNIKIIINNYDEVANKYFLADYISFLPQKKILEDGFKLLTVISRDPYDIVGMSTDRRWTSCMKLPNDNNMDGGCYHEKLYEDIKYGTLVAYLIGENDKNIENPYARIAIKPYKNIKDNTVRLYAEQRIYDDGSLGNIIYLEFKTVVNKFLDKINSDIDGVFVALPELYHDSADLIKLPANYKLEDIIDMDIIFGLKNGKKVIKGKDSMYDSMYDIYILDNKKYKIYDNNLEKTNFSHFRLNNSNNVGGRVNTNYDNRYSIYITKNNDNIANNIYRCDISLKIDAENLLYDMPKRKVIQLEDYSFIYVTSYANKYLNSKDGKSDLSYFNILSTDICRECLTKNLKIKYKQ